MEESLAESYYEQLKNTSNPVGILVGFYKSLFDVEVNPDTYKMFARLYKIYGKELVYYSLLDCSDMENIDFTMGISRLVSHFAKKRLEDKFNYTLPTDLTSLVAEYSKIKKPKRRIKVEDPFKEDSE